MEYIYIISHLRFVLYILLSDVGNFTINFLPDQEQYYCYTPTIEPYPGPSNTVSIQLLPPLPREGTVLIGQADDSRNLFSLHIKNNLLIFEHGVSETMLSVNLISVNETYQVDLTLTSDHSELLLKMVSRDGVAAEVENATSGNDIALSTTFTNICIGGSLLEVKNYIGTMQRIFFNYNSLLEEGNFCRLEARIEEHSDVVAFSGTNMSGTLPIERFSLRSAKIAFQIRYVEEDVQSAIIFEIKNGSSTLSISNINRDGQLIVLASSGFLLPDEMFVEIEDGQWHHFEISASLNQTEGGESELTVVYDGIEFVNRNVELTSLLPTFLDAPLLFGPDSSALHKDETAFRGCMRGFEFKATEESDVFRPNLEHWSRLNPSGLGVNECFTCFEQNLECSSGEVCVQPGYDEALECGCPQGFIGPTCQGIFCKFLFRWVGEGGGGGTNVSVLK